MRPNPLTERRHRIQIEPLSWWVSEFTEIVPVGHVLRPCLFDNWTRFHSLPESKRYAEDEVEYAEILRRHLAVGNEIFEPGEQIYVFQSRLAKGKKSEKRATFLAGRQLRQKIIKIPSQQPENDDQYCVRSLITTWIPDFFNMLNRQLADWIESNVTFVSPRTKNIYCPYDGGMDVFTFSMPPASLEEKFKSWMSTREDRL